MRWLDPARNQNSESIKFLLPPNWSMTEDEIDLLTMEGLTLFPIAEFLEHYRAQMEAVSGCACNHIVSWTTPARRLLPERDAAMQTGSCPHTRSLYTTTNAG